MTPNPQRTEALWSNFCQLRLRSSAYRAVDDPAVKSAYSDWLASYLVDSGSPQTSNVIPFRGARTVRR
jgi:hypothetical protein